MMERKIGAVFEYKGKRYEVRRNEIGDCSGCATTPTTNLCSKVGAASGILSRKDLTPVVIVEAEPHHGFPKCPVPDADACHNRYNGACLGDEECPDGDRSGLAGRQKNRDSLISERQRLLSKVWAEGWLSDEERVRRDEIEAELDRMENEDWGMDRPGLSDRYCSHCEKQGTDCDLCEGAGFVAEREPSNFERIATEIGKLTFEKNCAYGNSFAMSGEFLKLLYPDGLKPDQYGDALLLVRIFDKQMRIANNAGAFGESPYRDLVGYGLLGASLKEED